MKADLRPPAAASPRPRREQQRAIDTRDRILQAAFAEFAARGFEGASTRSVAEIAKVQHTLVTYHFNGKEGLWKAVFDRLVRGFVEQQRVRMEGLRGVEDSVKLKLLLEDFIRYSAENLSLHTLMGHAANRASPQLEAIVREYLRDYFDMIATLIVRVQDSGQFVAGDPHHLHYLFIGAATRIFTVATEAEQVMGRSPLDAEFIDIHVETCLRIFFR